MLPLPALSGRHPAPAFAALLAALLLLPGACAPAKLSGKRAQGEGGPIDENQCDRKGGCGGGLPDLLVKGKPGTANDSDPDGAEGSTTATWTVVPTAELEACVDNHTACNDWAHRGECKNNPGYMSYGCRASCGECQSTSCRDLQPHCPDWARQGECRSNHPFMLAECRFSCRVCYIDFRDGCTRGPDARPALVPGDLNGVFEAMVANKPLKPLVLSRDPWLLQLDGLVSPSEADQLLKQAGQNFQRSLAADQVSEARTSSQTWCDSDECHLSEPVKRVRQRFTKLVKVPETNGEHMQILKYEKGQAYKEHHDQNSARDSAWGPRLYSLLVYLSDTHTGGETNFPKLGVTVKPRKGRALVWPSVYAGDPYKLDNRTIHESLPVRKGEKYAANLWLHMFDFLGPFSRGCEQQTYFQEAMLDELWPAEASR